MIKYTEAYVNALARGLSGPTEQLIAAGAAQRQSFWTFRIPWFKHSYLLIATSERLLMIDHRRGLLFDRLDNIVTYSWADIASFKVSGLFSKKIVAKDANNRTLFALKSPPVLGPLSGNGAALSTIVQTWAERRALAPAQAHQVLPQHAAYGQPPYGAQAPALGGPQAYS